MKLWSREYGVLRIGPLRFSGGGYDEWDMENHWSVGIGRYELVLIKMPKHI